MARPRPEYRIADHRNEWLDRAAGVRKRGERITSITMLSGRTYTGKMFVDATYEGDLMAAAGVSYHVGRESVSTYGESWALLLRVFQAGWRETFDKFDAVPNRPVAA